MGNVQTVPNNIVEERLVMLKGKRGKEFVDERSKNCRLVKENWVDAYNHRDIRKVRNFCAKDSVAHFTGAESAMSLDAFMASCGQLYESFPDLILTYDSIDEISPGVVRIKNFTSRGTHTGKPYAFGPFPPVPTSGIVVDEDPCQLTLYINTKGKVTEFQIDMKKGDLVGPPGYYINIGGKMVFEEK